MSIIVLTCDTKKVKCSNRIRWETSVQNQNLDYYIMSTNLKWKGWKWRIQQYVNTLIQLKKEKKYTYAMITDCWDVIIQRTLTDDDYATLDNSVFLGAEKQQTGIREFTQKYKHIPWHNINGGFAIGKISNLIYLYKEVLKKWDSCKRHRNLKKTNDQHVLSYVFLYSTFPFNVILDLEKKFVLNFTKDVSKHEYNVRSKCIYSTHSKQIKHKPIALHNPGNPRKPIRNLRKIFNAIVY
jgi:hypothetical protein